MAITVVANSATPHSVKLVVTGTGGEEIFNRAAFAAGCAEGPLRQVLLAAAPADLDHFNVDGVRGNEIRIYDVSATPNDANSVKEGTRRIRWVGNADPASAGLSCTVTALAVLVIEIRYLHSTQA